MRHLNQILNKERVVCCLSGGNNNSSSGAREAGMWPRAQRVGERDKAAFCELNNDIFTIKRGVLLPLSSGAAAGEITASNFICASSTGAPGSLRFSAARALAGDPAPLQVAAEGHGRGPEPVFRAVLGCSAQRRSVRSLAFGRLAPALFS